MHVSPEKVYVSHEHSKHRKAQLAISTNTRVLLVSCELIYVEFSSRLRAVLDLLSICSHYCQDQNLNIL